MIIPESHKSDSIAPTVRSGDSHIGPDDAPASPPAYSATVASTDDLYASPNHRPATSFPRPALPANSSSSSFSPSSMSNPNIPPAPRGDLPPRCNHLIERKSNSSVSGTWHVDTALIIPERLLPHISDFDGSWNSHAQAARKEREKEIKKREKERGRRSSVDLPPLAPLVEVRPNLMIGSTNGAIKGNVHVVSSDGVMRSTTIVAQGTNGSVNLVVNASPEQPLRIYAGSTNGSVNVRVPSSFEGAVLMSTTWGSVKMSNAIKEKLTTFSSQSNTSRCFIGDWQAAAFGSTNNNTSTPDDDPPLPTLPETSDPFTSWTGPLVHLTSTNGSVSLSFIEESTASSASGGFWGFVSGLFGASGSGSGGGGGGGGGSDGHDGHGGHGGQAPRYLGPPSADPSPDGGAWPRDAKHSDGRMPGDAPDPA